MDIKYSGFRIQGRVRERQDQLVLLMVSMYTYTPTGQEIIDLKLKTEAKKQKIQREYPNYGVLYLDILLLLYIMENFVISNALS